MAMTIYRVLIQGENFLLEYEGVPTRMGFYTTRFVKAQDAIQAEAAAVNLVREDPKLRIGVLNDRADPPMLYVTEIGEADELKPPTGFVFYQEGAQDE